MLQEYAWGRVSGGWSGVDKNEVRGPTITLLAGHCKNIDFFSE